MNLDTIIENFKEEVCLDCPNENFCDINLIECVNFKDFLSKQKKKEY